MPEAEPTGAHERRLDTVLDFPGGVARRLPMARQIVASASWSTDGGGGVDFNSNSGSTSSGWSFANWFSSSSTDSSGNPTDSGGWDSSGGSDSGGGGGDGGGGGGD
jgi:hypothetical protein